MSRNKFQRITPSVTVPESFGIS